jgi:hypothetical protein
MRSGTARKHFVEYGWIWQGRYELLFVEERADGFQKEKSAVGLAGTPEYPKDGDQFALQVCGEQNAVVADPPAIHSFPFLPLKRFHVSLERIVCHVPRYPSNAFLDGLRQVFEVSFGVGSELTSPAHA